MYIMCRTRALRMFRNNSLDKHEQVAFSAVNFIVYFYTPFLQIDIHLRSGAGKRARTTKSIIHLAVFH